MNAQPVLIKACLNGARRPGSHPALPLTPEEIGLAARSAYLAGAGAVHVHPREGDGAESLRAEAVGNAVAAIQAACPGLPVGVTTGAWIVRDTRLRLEQVSGWRKLPDFASVNWSEQGAEELAELLLTKGVAVEAGLFSVEDAQAFAASGLGGRCLRALVEVPDEDGDTAVRRATAIDEALTSGRLRIPILHHGLGAATWAVIEVALRKGRDIRVGLEDTFVGPDGAPARDNAELVAGAASMAQALGLEPAPPPRTG